MEQLEFDFMKRKNLSFKTEMLLRLNYVLGPITRDNGSIQNYGARELLKRREEEISVKREIKFPTTHSYVSIEKKYS